MGQIAKTDEKHTSADTLREQIRHTEGDITRTIYNIEERLSPRYIRERGLRKVKHVGWQGAARVLDAAQRSSVQLSVVGAAALLTLLSNRNVRERVTFKRRRVAPKKFPAGALARAVGATALWLLSTKSKEKEKKGKPDEKRSVSRLAWAATAASAFMSGAKANRKKGNTRPGRNKAWRGLATAVGSALGSYWYSHRAQRV